jgi:hypothetical protein
MESPVELTITIKVDTAQAVRDVAEFQRYALQVMDEIRSAYAALSASASLDGGEFAVFDESLGGEQALKRRV